MGQPRKPFSTKNFKYKTGNEKTFSEPLKNSDKKFTPSVLPNNSSFVTANKNTHHTQFYSITNKTRSG